MHTNSFGAEEHRLPHSWSRIDLWIRALAGPLHHHLKTPKPQIELESRARFHKCGNEGHAETNLARNNEYACTRMRHKIPF